MSNSRERQTAERESGTESSISRERERERKREREEKKKKKVLHANIHGPLNTACPTFTTLTKIRAYMANERISSTNKSLKSKTITPQAPSLSHARFLYPPFLCTKRHNK